MSRVSHLMNTKIANKVRLVLESRYTIYLFYVLISVLILVSASLFRSYNWDMLLYAGSAKSFEIQDKEELHGYVYEEALKFVPEEPLYVLLGEVTPEQYLEGGYTPEEDELHASAYYMQVVSIDPEAFYQQLPFYQIKFLYVALVYGGAKLGLNIFQTTYIISGISAILGLWILLFTFRPYINNYLIYCIAIFALVYNIILVASIGTPDGLAFMMVCLIVYLFTRANWLIFLIIPLAVITRTELIIYGLMFLVYFAVYKKSWRYYSILSFIVCLLSYFLINHYYGNYGWMTLYYQSFLGRLTHPADTEIFITPLDYLRAYPYAFKRMVLDSVFQTFAGITVIYIYVLSKFDIRECLKVQSFKTMFFISIASYLYLGIRFVLFPSIMHRFLIAQYLIITAVLLYMISIVGSRQSSDHKELHK